MMDELDASPSSSSTTRLRRRSFFENIESDPSAFAPPALETVPLLNDDKDNSSSNGGAGSSASAAAGGSSASINGSGDGGGSGGDHSNDSKSDESVTQRLTRVGSGATPVGHGYRGGVPAALAQWLLACVFMVLYRLKAWLLLQWQRLRVRLHDQPPFKYIKMLRERSEAAAAVKHWAYPTQWITVGCVSLLMVQAVIFWYFQFEHFQLNVKECVFHEQLMPSVQSKVVASTGSSSPAMRYLERRFDQLHNPVSQTEKIKPRLPWTCISIVPTGGSEDETKLASDLAFLLPRSYVLEPKTAETVSSRFQVVVGSSPLKRTAEHTGVVGALFPLGAFRKELFSQAFPDVVLVKTEFALKKLIKYRQERQEEMQQNVQRVGDTDENPAAAHHELASSQFGIYLTKTTVPDIYNRRLAKNWDAFLHVVIVSQQDKKEQFTKELLTTWLQHPSWPMLHVRFENSAALCGSFVRLLSSIKIDAADHHKEEGVNEGEEYRTPSNIDISCDEKDNARSAIVALKNQIGMHVFPTPPETEELEEVALESLAVGAMVVTYNTPIMQEWIPDSCGLRVGTFSSPTSHGDGTNTEDGAFPLPIVQVAASEIEHAIESLLRLDRVNRVANGRAARLQFLRMRTHYLSATAALDTAVCDDDNDDAIEVQSEIGHRSRKKVEVETLRVFLY